MDGEVDAASAAFERDVGDGSINVACYDGYRHALGIFDGVW